MWKTEKINNNTIHVHPLADILTHSLTDRCFCSPAIERAANGFKIVVHNAFDGREKHEGARTN